MRGNLQKKEGTRLLNMRRTQPFTQFINCKVKQDIIFHHQTGEHQRVSQEGEGWAHSNVSRANVDGYGSFQGSRRGQSQCQWPWPRPHIPLRNPSSTHIHIHVQRSADHRTYNNGGVALDAKEGLWTMCPSTGSF